jgi:hypothetical protein
VCTNLSASHLDIEIYEGATKNVIGAKPSLKTYIGSIPPKGVWSSAEAQPTFTDAVFGPTIVIVKYAGQAQPQIYAFNADSREKIVLDVKDEGIVLSRFINGQAVVQQSIADNRYQEILLKLHRRE